MGSRQERAAESRVVRQVLEDPQLVAALQALGRVVDRARGPQGRIQSLHNSVGGPLTTTTSCTRLLQALALSRPCLRLVASAVQGHLKTHHDGGLLTASLCLHLVQNAVKLESVGRLCVREAYCVFLRAVDDYLNAENCPMVVSVDASSLKVMLGYVRSIVSTKPVCNLRPASAGHVSRMVLKAFLTSVPDGPPPPRSFLSDRVFVLQTDKTDLSSSEVLEGLLLEWPERCAQLGPQEISLLLDDSGRVKVALFNVSMSGDTEEAPTDRVEGRSDVVRSAAELVVSRMLELCDWLVERRVGVVLCQRVVHPRVKTALRQRGVVLVDRLGLQPISYVQDLTGAVPISSVLVRPAESVCGVLSAAEHLVLHGKSYLHLQREDSCVCTLLLCAPVEQQLAELKCAVQSAMTGLCSTFQRPKLLCGGGCWQFHLSTYLAHMVRKRGAELCGELSITQSQLQACAQAFGSSLESTARSLLGPAPSFQAWVNTAGDRHVWHAPPGVNLVTEEAPFSCACGAVTSRGVDQDSLRLHHSAENWGDCDGAWGDGVGTERLNTGAGGTNYDWLVLDTMDCAVSALRTAVATACMVLSFTQFIHDVN